MLALLNEIPTKQVNSNPLLPVMNLSTFQLHCSYEVTELNTVFMGHQNMCY